MPSPAFSAGHSQYITTKENAVISCLFYPSLVPGGALGYFSGGYVPPGTPNWHPVLKKISPEIDTPF